MSISASDVAELRKSTGAGLMDCKKALQESNGDYEGAIDYLRKKGQKVAEKRADKDANEGAVVALLDSTGKNGVVLALSCETDFVAKNEGFVELANKLAKLGLDNKVDSHAALMALPFEGMTVEEKLVDQTGKTGEKIVVSAFHRMSGEHLATYIHAGAKIGVLLAYKAGDKPDADQFFRSLAMHIAAMNPSIMHYSEFDTSLVEKETESFRSRIQIENEDLTRLGKPLKNVPQYVSRLQLTPEVLEIGRASCRERV